MKAPKSTTKAPKADAKVISKVKSGGVTKSSSTPKAKSKEIAKKVAAKAGKEVEKRKKKAPTPSESSESDSDEEMKNASSSSSESESESEEEPKVAPKKAAAKVAAKAESESDSESESSESSEDEEPAKNGTKAKAAESDSDSSEESESESDSEPASKAEPKGGVKVDAASESEDSDSESESESDEAPAKTKTAAAEESASGDSDDSEESATEDSSEESDSEEQEEKPAKTQKRKAETEEAPVTKKAKKTEGEASNASANLFVGNLSWNVDEEWLRSEFESFGELSGVRIVTDRDSGRSRGFGYVEFSNADDAAKAFEAKQDTELDGRKINLDFANARQNNAGTADRAQSRAKTFGDQTSPESDTLFIGNISFDADENMLQETFSSHGSILGIRLPTDPDSGRPKGFGYVQFSSVDEARSALGALQGADVGGRPVRLDFSTPRQNSGGSGFGGGFGGRGGRGGGRGRGGPRGGSRGGPRGGGRGGRGGSTNRGGFGDFSGKKITF